MSNSDKTSTANEGSTKPIAGNRATDSDWNAHLAAINKWIAAYPDSATPRIALADTYINYAWAARGQGYANTVSESGWSLFDQRIELGKAALLEAAHVKERCPNCYQAMQRVTLAWGGKGISEIRGSPRAADYGLVWRSAQHCESAKDWSATP